MGAGPMNWRATFMPKDLLKRTPNLLIVSSNWRRFDQSCDACTAAGVLVVNQSGARQFRRRTRARALLITLSKRILESTGSLRRDRNVNRMH